MQPQLNQNTLNKESIILCILRPSPTEEERKNRIPITEKQLQAIKEMQLAHEEAYYATSIKPTDFGHE